MIKKKRLVALMLCATIIFTDNIGSLAAAVLPVSEQQTEVEDWQELEAEELDTEELDTEELYIEELGAEELGTEELGTEELDTEELDTEELDTEEPDTKEPDKEKGTEESEMDLPVQGIIGSTGAPIEADENKVIWVSGMCLSSASVSLQWQPLAEADGYEIYRSTNATSGYQRLAVINQKETVSYLDSNCQPGITYYYQIQGYKGVEKYSFSQSLRVDTLEQVGIKNVKSYESSVLEISWNEVKSASGYEVYCQNLTTKSYEKVATVEGQKTTSYRHRGRKKGTEYSYKVKAFIRQNNSIGYGDESSAKSGWSIGKTTIKKIVSKTDGTLEISWKKINDVYRYQVYRSTTQNGTYTLLATIKSDKTKYKDTTAKKGKKYYYKIRTVNRVNGKNGYGSYSAVVYGVALARPVITYVKSNSTTSLGVRWNKILDADGYYVYRSTKKNGSYKKIATIGKGKTISYTDKKRKAGTTYYYQIQPYNKKGTTVGLGATSKAVGGKTLPKASLQKVVSKSGSSLKLSWKKVTGATGYEIARSTSKNGTYKVVKTIKSATTVSYTDKKLKTGKTYYYKVRAIQIKKNAQGNGSYSAVLSGKTATATKITKLQSVADESIRLKWKAASGAAGYQIYRSDSLKGKYVRIKTINGKNSTTYDDKVPTTNKVYYYKIRVFNKNNGEIGYGNWSEIKKGKALKKPTIKSPVLQVNGAIQISWKKVSGANGYEVYRRIENGSYQKIAEIDSGTTLSYADSDVRAGINYHYKVRAKNVYNNVTGTGGYSQERSYYIFYYEIMGETTVSAAQMAACYRGSGHSYPAWAFAERGAGSIDDFAQIVIEEAAAEGVRAEVLWGQIILETGWLQYRGSMVGPEQCNFGGLGATDNSGGAYVASFPDVRTGIRAQVQHLKAYASTAPLNNPCVDTRFSLVRRGTSIYVEWLGQQENPQGFGWATGLGYGDKIRRLINQTKSY